MLVVLVFFVTLSIPALKSDQATVLILARGNSRGIRLKNLQNVGQSSLLQRAISSAKCAGFTDIVVSTDHPLIAYHALINDVSVFRRSWITATDWAPSIWGAAEFLSQTPETSILILLQATSPFTTHESLRTGLNLLKGPKAFDCVFSVTRSYKLRWKENGRKIQPLNFNIQSRPRRQDWSGEFIETGAFYITRRHLIEKGYFQNNNCTVVELSFYEGLEVDSHADLELANIIENWKLFY